MDNKRGLILSICVFGEGSLLYALPEPCNQYLITDLVDWCSEESKRCHNVPKSTERTAA